MNTFEKAVKVCNLLHRISELDAKIEFTKSFSEDKNVETLEREKQECVSKLEVLLN